MSALECLAFLAAIGVIYIIRQLGKGAVPGDVADLIQGIKEKIIKILYPIVLQLRDGIESVLLLQLSKKTLTFSVPKFFSVTRLNIPVI